MQGITNIHDRGLEQVACLKALRHLDLGHCWRVTDAGVEFLLRLPFLAHLDLAYCWQVLHLDTSLDVTRMVRQRVSKSDWYSFASLAQNY